MSLKQKKFEYLKEKVENMQAIVDNGFETWVDDETKVLFLDKFEKRKEEVNKLYRELLSQDE